MFQLPSHSHHWQYSVEVAGQGLKQLLKGQCKHTMNMIYLFIENLFTLASLFEDVKLTF